MSLADTIYQLSLKLPDEAAQEALDFIEFLGQRYGVADLAAADGDATTYDTWFRSQVQQALDDPRPGVSDDDARRHFASRRGALRSQGTNRG